MPDLHNPLASYSVSEMPETDPGRTTQTVKWQVDQLRCGDYSRDSRHGSSERCTLTWYFICIAQMAYKIIKLIERKRRDIHSIKRGGKATKRGFIPNRDNIKSLHHSGLLRRFLIRKCPGS